MSDEPKKDESPDESPDVPELPEGADRRAFLMRSALIGAVAVLNGAAPASAAETAKKASTAKAPPLSPTLDHTLAEQFATIGVKPEQIALVGISHYHFDHVGQAAEFPKAKLLIGRADLEALKTEPVPFGADPRLLAPWLKDGAPLEEVTGDKDIYGDGSVTMLSMPGHTPGSYALLVRLKDKGPVLLSGDIVHFEEQFKANGVPGFNTDRSESLASMDRMQKIAKRLKATLVVQHDANDIAKLPAFPKSAE